MERVNENSERYPARLLPLKGMPKELYFRGSLPGKEPAAAIVGSRSCSAYGRRTALELGKMLARNGISVISGMASGIDSAAHEGAVEGGGRTYAVLGCGADVCYPSENAVLYEEILRNGGILSEYPAGTKPLPWHFPQRNRIISALSDIVIVVEARRKSGSLITADFALEQGRTVMACPGRIGDALSEGCNRLIAEGAAIVYGPEAVLDEFGLTEPYRESRKKEQVKNLGVPALTVWNSLSDEPVTADFLSGQTGLYYTEAEGAVLELILAGFAEEVAPGLYVRR